MADQEIKGGEVRLGINVTPEVTPAVYTTMNEKLSADLNLNRAEIALDPAYDSDGWRKVFSGLKSGNIPLPFYMRRDSAMYKFLFDAWNSGELIPVQRVDPTKTVTGDFRLVGDFNESDTGNEQVIKISATLQLNSSLTYVYTA